MAGIHGPKGISRKKARELARLAKRGDKQIQAEKNLLIQQEKERFMQLPIHKRLQYFYKNHVPSKKAKRWFWPLLVLIIPFSLLYSIIYNLRIDIAWRWSKQLYFAIINK